MKTQTMGLLAVVCLLSGCATTPTLDELTSGNRDRLADITIGMSKHQVVELMGSAQVETVSGACIRNPYSREAVIGPAGAFLDILFYCTGQCRDGRKVTDEDLSPIVFSNGHVIGWGWTFFERRSAPATLSFRRDD